MSKKNKPKKINLEDLGGFVFSTNPDFSPEVEIHDEEAVAPEDQLLELYFEKKGRGGKQVVIVAGFEGTEDALKDLAKNLRQHCGVGGTVKDGEILLQGNVREKATSFLNSKGFKTKRIGG